MMENTENSKEATRQLLELINEFGKVANYKINTQKFVAFFYTNNGVSGSEIQGKKFTITTKIIKYININLL